MDQPRAATSNPGFRRPEKRCLWACRSSCRCTTAPPSGTVLASIAAASPVAEVTASSLSPAQPPGSMGMLPPDCSRDYLRRWTGRHPRAGWVVRRQATGALAGRTCEGTGLWFWEQLFRTHVPTRAYAGGHRDLVWLEPAPPEAQRPALRASRWMPDDRLVDSRRPSDVATPELARLGRERKRGNAVAEPDATPDAP